MGKNRHFLFLAALILLLCGCGSNAATSAAPSPEPQTQAAEEDGGEAGTAPEPQTPEEDSASSGAETGFQVRSVRDRMRDMLEDRENETASQSNSVQNSTSETAGDSGTASRTSSVRDRMRAMMEDSGDAAADAPPVTTAKPETTAASATTKPASTAKSAAEKTSAGAIAELAKLRAKVSFECRDCVVDVDDEHNPYDVTWNYFGEYTTYVRLVDKAGMWDVLFDAQYYISTYPMLARLYHNNEALLLEHFQTVGIHEGRQGSKNFNVAAYIDNCDGSLIKAFGDNYECYYFYYALNQETESRVDVSNKSGKYPVQMDIELTALQSRELEGINGYREEAGSNEVATNAELLAFANYRAWVNYTNDEKYAQVGHGHDWAIDNEDALYDMMDHFGADSFAENTVHGDLRGKVIVIEDKDYAKGYRDSSEHYESMVSREYKYAAPSNVYARWYEGKAHYCQYDLYLDACK